MSTVAETRRAAQYPASLAQQRFWVLDKLEPRNSALNVAVRWRIEGDLPVELIEKAFVQIVERHETLRTSFIEIDGEPFQSCSPKSRCASRRIDLTARPEAEAFAECDHIARAEATTPFNLAIAPLIRDHARPGASPISPSCSSPHITPYATAGRSACLAREMGDACAALQAGRRPHLPNLPITYGDYAAWQRDVVLGEGLAPEIEYWSRALTASSFSSCRPISRAEWRKDPPGRSNRNSWTETLRTGWLNGRAPEWLHAVHAGVLRSCHAAASLYRRHRHRRGHASRRARSG